MSARAIIRQAKAEGVVLAVTADNGLSYDGPTEAFERLRPAIITNKNAIVDALLADEESARASVEKIYAEMAERAEASREWWAKPVEGRDDGNFTIRNVVTGKVTAIDLRGDRA